MIKIIGLGEYAVGSLMEDSIKTYALASCIGLVLYDPKAKILGMVHIVLPDSQGNTDKLYENKKAYFADRAVPLIFQQVFGGYPDSKTPYQVSLYGGAASKNEQDVFCVGERNLSRTEQILRDYSIRYDKRNTGGHCSRTIEAYVKDGKVNIYSQAILL